MKWADSPRAVAESADVTFTMVTNTNAMVDAYKRCRDYLDAAIELVRPGRTTGEIASVWPKATEFGFQNEEAAFALQYGHGVGLAIWEKPVISRLVSLDHPAEIKPPYTDLLVKLIGFTLRDHPRVNASWVNGNIQFNQEINIGLAVAIDDGLIVPVIRNANKSSVGEIAAQRKDLAERAQTRKLRPADISDGTFTLSNLGMYNVDIFNAIVNTPQAAILAVGRIAERVVAVNGQPAVRSTVLRTISGLLKPRIGEIVFDGQTISGMNPRQILSVGIAQVPQNHSLFPDISVRENVRLGALILDDSALVEQRLNKVEELFPIVKQRAKDRAGDLSGGQQRLIEFARSLMFDPKLILLDEPSMGLDPMTLKQVFETIKLMNSSGRTILLVEQNVRAGLGIATQGVVMESGQVRLEGTHKEILDNPQIGHLYLGGTLSGS